MELLVAYMTAHLRRIEESYDRYRRCDVREWALKLSQPLPLRKHKKVRVTIEVEPSPLLRAYGIMGSKGDAETIERVALGLDFDPLEE